ncbi:MAG TPA: hypothetical protein VM287_08580 [Egibacteraceae bacterium]|nr:hypothetical protein [Egibacteraceae bacterium]
MARLRLTDQALVAVTAARQAAQEHGRHPTAAHLLIGLAVEAEGQAGALLRTPPTAAAQLLQRALTPPPGLPPLEAVLAQAGAGAPVRPVATRGLLAAALEVGGSDLVDLLAVCGYAPRRLYRAAMRDFRLGEETFGLGSDPDLAPDAAAAVARVRAAAGGAVDLVLAIATMPRAEELIPEDPDGLVSILTQLSRSGEVERAGDRWDHGLDGVVAAARAWVQPPIGIRDLLRAAAVAGGRGPGRLLEEADRRGFED